jgi:hypothetical protein
MGSWVFTTQVTNIIVVGISSFFLLCGPNADAAQEVRPARDQTSYIHPTGPPVVVDAALERSIQFQRLVSRWRRERGATSSIGEMCTTPAYLSILAMGPDALPLLLGQLQSEGDDPDHWFVALHYVTKGIDPVSDQDRGDMAKMSEAWLEWAERKDDAR